MKFYSVEDCNKLTNVEVRKLYRDHVSPYIEEIFGSFSAGSVEMMAKLVRFVLLSAATQFLHVRRSQP